MLTFLLNLPFTPQRSLEKRTQAVADLEDILLAFSKLDDTEKIPQIYCEASELVTLPPIAADPISEFVTGNRVCLQETEANISLIQEKLARLNATTSSVEVNLASIRPSSSYTVAARKGHSSVSRTSVPKVTRVSLASRAVHLGPQAGYVCCE